MKLISDHKFTEGTEIRQAATLMCTAVYPPLPIHPPPRTPTRPAFKPQWHSSIQLMKEIAWVLH